MSTTFSSTSVIVRTNVTLQKISDSFVPLSFSSFIIISESEYLLTVVMRFMHAYSESQIKNEIRKWRRNFAESETRLRSVNSRFFFIQLLILIADFTSDYVNAWRYVWIMMHRYIDSCVKPMPLGSSSINVTDSISSVVSNLNRHPERIYIFSFLRNSSL